MNETELNALTNIFACLSPVTKNVGAILIQKEALTHYRLQTTAYRYYESHSQ